MPLEKIEAHNFKSFRDLSVELGPLTVLIGANASGKSNFVQLLRFLHDIAAYGLDNAASLQGSKEFLFNLGLGANEPLRIKVLLGSVAGNARLMDFVTDTPQNVSESLILSPLCLSCDFGLRNENFEGGWHISYDRAVLSREVSVRGDDGSLTSLGPAKIEIDAKHSRKHTLSLPPGIAKEQVFSSFWLADLSFLEHVGSTDGRLLLEHFLSRASWPTPSSFNAISQLAVYDFHAKLPKETAQISGKIDLEEDGSNLVIVLKRLLEDQEQRRIFSNLLTYVLPFAAEVDVQRLADRFLHFRLRETYLGDKFLPASLLSDGTINVIALIVALFFTDKPLIVIEEPEKNIHPSLIARVAELLKDASRHKQIIVTTHSPELVKYMDLDSLLLIARDREGFSTVQKPADSERVRIFLENEIGVEDLFARNLLGA